MIGKNIHVTLGRREILHGLDFSAEDGRITAIVGPNGSGKSTLIKALTGELPATGALHLNGRDVETMQPCGLPPEPPKLRKIPSDYYLGTATSRPSLLAAPLWTLGPHSLWS